MYVHVSRGQDCFCTHTCARARMHTHRTTCLLSFLLLSPPLMQAPLYYRKANAALVLYDITKQASFEEAKGWVEGMFADEILAKYMLQ